MMDLIVKKDCSIGEWDLILNCNDLVAGDEITTYIIFSFLPRKLNCDGFQIMYATI